MDFKDIKEIIDMVNSSEISYFNYETNDGHLVLDKSLVRNETNEKSLEYHNEENSIKYNDVKEVNTINTSNDNPNSEVTVDNEDLYIITSPMVGTFYSSSSPDSEAYVNVGDNINKGSILCIVEAMKLMNEIESEVSGVIKEILVKDGEMVEYGQPMFKIKEM